MTTRYFLGIDIGGSKSHALIADESGQAAGFGQAGAGNWEIIGWEGTRQVLHNIVDQALVRAGIDKTDVTGAGFGIAGYDWPEDRLPHEQIIKSLGLNAPYVLGNDTLVGLVAGATAGWGIVVVAGTSNNCLGRDRHGREARVTGMGSWLAEYGGAGEISNKALQAIALAWTKRGPATQLSQAFVKEAGASNIPDLLAGLARKRYHLSAAMAPIVFAVADDGDEVAQGIIRWAGEELGSLANGVIRQLNFEGSAFEVVLAGSLYNGGSVLMQTLRETIHALAPKAKLVRLQAPPVTGGVLLGMEQVNLDTAAIRPTLIETTNFLLQQYADTTVYSP